MKRAQIVSTLDRVRVLESFTPSGTPQDRLACMVAFNSSPVYIERLIKRLQSARPVKPMLIPPDLVTMNSVVRVLDEETGDEDSYALVYPDASPEDMEWVNIHSKLGSELFGRWVGEEIELPARWGTHKVRIAGLDYQPESAGHYDR